MAYQQKTWADRQSEYPNRRRLSPVAGADSVYEVSREEGLVVEEGDPFDRTSMNAFEGRVASAFGEIMGGAVKVGKAAEADSAVRADKAAIADSANAVAWGNVGGKPATYPPSGHTHDERYYTEGEVNGLLAGKSATATYYATIGAAMSQNIGVAGIGAADNPIVDVMLSGNPGTDLARLAAWSVVGRIITYNGGITVVCYEQPPAVSIPIQIKVVR